MRRNTDVKIAKRSGDRQVQGRLREGAFIAYCALAVFLFVALYTYSAADSGWSRATSTVVVHNAAGGVGAWFADLLLTFFGYVAYILPILLTIFALNKREKLMWLMQSTGILMIVVSGCALVDMIVKQQLYGELPGPTGGILGNLLNYWLMPHLNFFGDFTLFFAMFLVGVTLGTGVSWVRLIELLGKFIIAGSVLLAKGCGALYAKGKGALDKFLEKRSRTAQAATLQRREPVVEAVREDKTVKELPKKTVLQFVKPQLEKVAPVAMPVAKKATNKFPDLDLLERTPPHDPKKSYSVADLESLSKEVEDHLLDFGIEVKVVAVCPGPIITRFEMTLAPGIKASKITGLARDLARSLSVTSVRVVEVIPGKSVVGLEIPNKHREVVKLREVLESKQYQEKDDVLSLALGKDIAGLPVVVSLDRMPHLLVAGTTGSGKSVAVNVMLLSLLFKAKPEDLRLILIDPKMLELSIYDNIAHLLTPVVTDMNDAANALRWCVAEMERRYQLMSEAGVRNITGFNAKGGEKLPYIVVIIDEFADMMLVVGKKVEELITRIAQKARAAGIHLILATQRPSVDVITGLIKANVPTRIAFQVSSRIDSRTILDQQGAEQLLGQGDMLYLAPGSGIPTRVHGAFVSDEEVHNVVNAIKQNLPAPEYINDISTAAAVPGIDQISELGEQDPMYDEAVSIVIESQKASISYLQRRLKIGYNRSARLIEAMEAAGLVTTMLPNGTREVKI